MVTETIVSRSVVIGAWLLRARCGVRWRRQPATQAASPIRGAHPQLPYQLPGAVQYTATYPIRSASQPADRASDLQQSSQQQPHFSCLPHHGFTDGPRPGCGASVAVMCRISVQELLVHRDDARRACVDGRPPEGLSAVVCHESPLRLPIANPATC